MPTLSDYLTETTDLLHDSGNQFYSSALVTRYINQARKQIAAASGCIRRIPAYGTGVSDWKTVAAQEIYTFATLNALLTVADPAILGVMRVAQVGVNWGGFIPTLQNFPWGRFNAYFRAVNTSGVQGFPSCWAQLGQGDAGSVYLYPIPTQAAGMLWDCRCLPVPLVDDTTLEGLPYPWTDVVQFWAASLCYRNAMRKGDANEMMGEAQRKMKIASAATIGTMIPNFYAPGSPGIW